MPIHNSVSSSGECRYVLSMRIDATSYHAACDRILAWARAGQSRSVFFATVNTVMTGFDRPAFLQQVNGADLVTSDGMPMVWALRGLGVAGATRVYGPDLTAILLEKAEKEGLCAGFLGGSPETLSRLLRMVRSRYPALTIGFAHSPPFRPPTPREDAEVLEGIRSADVRILFVGLGCPKQERWIAEHQGGLACVALAVGAAFDFLAGTLSHAPHWMQSSGLEWLFRLAVEPRRLWRRYLILNPRFIWHFGRELLLGGRQTE